MNKPMLAILIGLLMTIGCLGLLAGCVAPAAAPEPPANNLAILQPDAYAQNEIILMLFERDIVKMNDALRPYEVEMINEPTIRYNFLKGSERNFNTPYDNFDGDLNIELVAIVLARAHNHPDPVELIDVIYEEASKLSVMLAVDLNYRIPPPTPA